MSKIRWFALAVLTACFCFVLSPVVTTRDPQSTAPVQVAFDQFDKDLYVAVVPLVCLISIYDDKDKSLGTGTGFKCLWKGKTYIVSAGHMVIDTGTRAIRTAPLSVAFKYKAGFKGVAPPMDLKIVGANHESDVAVFSTDDKRFKEGGLTLDAIDAPVGTDVWKVGNPLVYRNFMGKGIITGTDGNSLVTNIGVIFGDSGSPVLNRDKFVVGLVSAVASDGYQVYPHIGFLVRVSAIRKELAKL